jgi:hypothetical protein
MWWLSRRAQTTLPALHRAADRVADVVADDLVLLRGLAGDRDAVPALVGLAARRDEDKAAGGQVGRTEPTWIRALITLRLLHDPAAGDVAVSRLHACTNTSDLLHLLRYLAAVARLLTNQQRAATKAAVLALLERSALGDDFAVQGSGTPNIRGASTSHRWGLELLAAYLLEQLGVEQQPVWDAYDRDSRAYARTYSRHLQGRLADDPPPTQTGSIQHELAVGTRIQKALP